MKNHNKLMLIFPLPNLHILFKLFTLERSNTIVYENSPVIRLYWKWEDHRYWQGLQNIEGQKYKVSDHSRGSLRLQTTDRTVYNAKGWECTIIHFEIRVPMTLGIEIIDFARFFSTKCVTPATSWPTLRAHKNNARKRAVRPESGEEVRRNLGDRK